MHASGTTVPSTQCSSLLCRTDHEELRRERRGRRGEGGGEEREEGRGRRGGEGGGEEREEGRGERGEGRRGEGRVRLGYKYMYFAHSIHIGQRANQSPTHLLMINQL